MLDQVFFHNSVRDWLTAVGVALGVFVVLWIARSILSHVLSRKISESDTEERGLLLALTKRIHLLFLMVMALYAGSRVLSFPETTSGYVDRIILVIILLQAALVGSRAIRFVIERYKRQKLETNPSAVAMTGSIGFLLTFLLWVIFVLLVLDNFGIHVTTLIAGLGIGGIAVALAVQRLLGDLIASFTIVFDKPFVIGDFIIVGDFLGTVEHIGLKTTRIRSLSGEQLIFPNGDLLQSRVRNFKRMQERRVVFTIGVLYQTTPEQLREIPGIIRTAIESQQPVRFDRAHFKEYGPYSLNFEIVYWIQNPDYTVYMDIQQAINLYLYEQFQERGIQFAYPTQTLFVEGSSSPQTGNSQAGSPL